VKSVLDSEPFKAAAGVGYRNKPVRRIVVWILEAGHIEAFCWDRRYSPDGVAVEDILYMVSTMHQSDFDRDPNIHDNVLREFKHAMVQRQLIALNTRTISDLLCREKLRNSILPYEDFWCVLSTAFNVCLLSQVVDMEVWDGSDIPSDIWNFCYSLYSKFENEMAIKFKDLVSDGKTALWICPALLSKHLNINDVHLLVVNVENNTKQKLSFHWTNFWTLSDLQ
jgi:hypothetical protein